MRNYYEYVGKTINRWTIRGLFYKQIGKQRAGFFDCKCTCEKGTERIVRASDIIHEKSKSCGCLHREIVIATNITHGESKDPLYKTWAAMKTRVNNPNQNGYEYYGGRNIRYCSEWEHYEPFREWALIYGYQTGLSLDRIDPDGNYCPENCRWATDETQSRNQRVRKDCKSGIKGVRWHTKNLKWYADIRAGGKRIHLGFFDNKDEAIKAREAAEFKYWVNSESPMITKRALPTGVYADKGKWRARINVEGKMLSLGTFADLDNAVEARHAAEVKYWGKAVQ